MTEKNLAASAQVAIPSVEALSRDLKKKLGQFEEATRKEYEANITLFVELSKKGYKVDSDKLPEFLKEFWRVYRIKADEYEVAVPIIFPSFNVGYFDRQEGGYNIFKLNNYTRQLGDEVPLFLRKEIKLPEGLPVLVDGLNVIYPEGFQESVEEKFGEHLSLVDKDHARVKQGHEFQLLVSIIQSGRIPFKPHPISKEDLRVSDFSHVWDEMEDKSFPLNIFEGKYSFQGDAWRTFEEFGAIGVFWAMGSGKTVIGTFIFSCLKGSKALVVPTIILKEQWQEFWKHNCPRLLNEVDVYTYAGMSRKDWKALQSKEYTVVGFDECHFLPAPSFSRLATLKMKYRFGLSATPYREDGHTDYIMALTGQPVGVDWRKLLAMLGKTYHAVNVHIVKDLQAKYALVRQLYNPERRTLLFVNLLEIGESLSEMLEVPFIHGGTKRRLEVVREAKSFVASRVLELGVSIKDLEHIIEVDFLFGSRREELQRTGRLMHSQVKAKVHDIIMTLDEYEHHGKRLYGLYERGIRWNLIPHLVGISDGELPKKHAKTGRGNALGTETVDKLFQEGYFQVERKLGQINGEVEKRGGRVVATTLFGKLDRMTRQGRLYKIKTDEGYQFKQR